MLRSAHFQVWLENRRSLNCWIQGLHLNTQSPWGSYVTWKIILFVWCQWVVSLSTLAGSHWLMIVGLLLFCLIQWCHVVCLNLVMVGYWTSQTSANATNKFIVFYFRKLAYQQAHHWLIQYLKVIYKGHIFPSLNRL